jgi:hypothetical protein
VTYSNVPDTLVLNIVQRYDNTADTLAAGATTTGAYSYSAPSAGSRSITIIKRI